MKTDNNGRFTDLIRNERLFKDLGTPVFDPAEDRVMICGNPQMMNDLAVELESGNFTPGTDVEPGEFLIEKAFAEK